MCDEGSVFFLQSINQSIFYHYYYQTAKTNKQTNKQTNALTNPSASLTHFNTSSICLID